MSKHLSSIYTLHIIDGCAVQLLEGHALQFRLTPPPPARTDATVHAGFRNEDKIEIRSEPRAQRLVALPVGEDEVLHKYEPRVEVSNATKYDQADQYHGEHPELYAMLLHRPWDDV